MRLPLTKMGKMRSSLGEADVKGLFLNRSSLRCLLYSQEEVFISQKFISQARNEGWYIAGRALWTKGFEMLGKA